MVNSQARKILGMYAEQTKWESEQYQFRKVPTTINENTIVFVYGWFGLWNDDLCSVDDAKTACNNLLEILNKTKNVKIIIEMRRDLYTQYKEELSEYEPLFKNQMCPDLKRLHDAFLNNFDEQKKKCGIPKCFCKDITPEMLLGGDDELIGVPLKVEILAKHHDPNVLFSYKKHNDILRSMKEHFTDLEKIDKPLYEWIMYICLKGDFTTKSFDKKMVEKVGFKIEGTSFNEHLEKLRKYIQACFFDSQHMSESPGNVKYVFWHPFIYICAFHSLYETHKDIVMNHCNISAILQLVRPKASGKSAYNIEVSTDNSNVKLLRERLQGKGNFKHHPLFIDVKE